MVTATMATGRASAVVLALSSVMYGAQWPVTSHIMNRTVTSTQRATVISLVCMEPFFLFTFWVIYAHFGSIFRSFFRV
jgi:hypothetical protein